MITVTKRDLIELGYGPSFAADIIKKAKELMVEKGHTYYQSVSYTHLDVYKRQLRYREYCASASYKRLLPKG